MKIDELLTEVAQNEADDLPPEADRDGAILRPLDAQEQADIVDGVLAALGEQRAQRPRRRSWVRASAGLSFVAAAAAVVLLWVRPSGDGFRARSGGSGPGLRVVEVVGPDDSRPLGDSLAAGHALAFVYSNPSESPYRWVAVVGRDAAGAVHWYHPLYGNAGETPRSVAIEAGVAEVQLPDAVRAEHAAGPLEICALFTEAPLDVTELDAALEAGADWPDDGAKACTQVEVRR